MVSTHLSYLVQQIRSEIPIQGSASKQMKTVSRGVRKDRTPQSPALENPKGVRLSLKAEKFSDRVETFSADI